MKPVPICVEGVIANLLDHGYTLDSTIYEKLNNVIHLNDNEGYTIEFHNGKVGDYIMTSICERLARGFESVSEIKGAFTLNNSARTGLNNKGMGIFSPLCINRKNITTGVFIQMNSNGNFLVLINWDPTKEPLIEHYTFTLGENVTLCDDDGRIQLKEKCSNTIKKLMKDRSTLEVWVDNYDHQNTNDSIYRLLRLYTKVLKNPVSTDSDEEDKNNKIAREIGLRYHQFKGSIVFNGKTIYKWDPMHCYDGTPAEHEHKYEVLVTKNTNSNKMYLSTDLSNSGAFFKLNKGSFNTKKPVRKIQFELEKSCIITITDLGIDSNTSRKNSLDNYIYIEIGGTIVAKDTIKKSGNPWPNMRIKVSIVNNSGNDVSDFVILNGDKSKSSLNREFYEKLEHLIKHSESVIGKVAKKDKDRKHFSEKDIKSRLCNNPYTDLMGTKCDPAIGLRYEVDHEDGDKTNNDPSNLSLLSPDEHSIKSNDPTLWRRLTNSTETLRAFMIIKLLELAVAINKLGHKEITKDYICSEFNVEGYEEKVSELKKLTEYL